MTPKMVIMLVFVSVRVHTFQVPDEHALVIESLGWPFSSSSALFAVGMSVHTVDGIA